MLVRQRKSFINTILNVKFDQLYYKVTLKILVGFAYKNLEQCVSCSHFTTVISSTCGLDMRKLYHHQVKQNNFILSIIGKLKEPDESFFIHARTVGSNFQEMFLSLSIEVDVEYTGWCMKIILVLFLIWLGRFGPSHTLLGETLGHTYQRYS